MNRDQVAALRRVERATAKLGQAKADRDAAIRAAYRAGVQVKGVLTEAAKLSRARVNQIIAADSEADERA